MSEVMCLDQYKTNIHNQWNWSVLLQYLDLLCQQVPPVISNDLGYHCNHTDVIWNTLTHRGRVTHICVDKLIIIGSGNGLSPDRRQAIIWTNARLLSIGPLRTYFNENLIKIQQFSLKKMYVKMASAKWRPSCLGLNVITSAACCAPRMLYLLHHYTGN